MTSNPSLAALNDHALLSQFSELVRQDREGKANLLRHIDAIDQRKLWARLGHPTMFDFLITRHHMSEATACKRIGAARAAHRFPMLFEMVGRGEIHLSGIHRLKAHLTQENHQRVLEQAKHKTIRQIEVLVAHLAPQRDVPSTLRALPNRTTIAQPVLAPAPPPPRRDPAPEPLAPGRYKLTVTISESTRAKLKQLEDLLAQQVRKGDTAALLDRALDALLTQVKKRKIGMTDKPRASKPTGKPARAPRRTRHIAAAARRDVWPRDDGRCGFVGEDGHRCNETRGVEFAHIEPWAKGGANTADNLGLRCPAHNALEADRDYGTRFMTKKRTQQPLKVREPRARYALSGEPCGTLVDVDPSALPSGGGSSFDRSKSGSESDRHIRHGNFGDRFAAS